MGKKRSATWACLKVVDADVSLNKNCRNLIKMVESTLNFYRARRSTYKPYKYKYNINAYIQK